MFRERLAFLCELILPDILEQFFLLHHVAGIFDKQQQDVWDLGARGTGLPSQERTRSRPN